MYAGPEALELGLYEDIPHLLAPVVLIRKCVERSAARHTPMRESRLKLLAERGVRNIDQYLTSKGPVAFAVDDVETPSTKPLPYIVIVIDTACWAVPPSSTSRR